MVTSYRTTAEYLAAAVERTGARDWVIHGGMTDAERSASISEFRENGGMLLSSIAVPLDLVGAVIHYGLPMSPARLALLEEDLQRAFGRDRCAVYLFRDESEPLPNELLTYEMARQFDPLGRQMEHDAVGVADPILALVANDQDSVGALHQAIPERASDASACVSLRAQRLGTDPLLIETPRFPPLRHHPKNADIFLTPVTSSRSRARVHAT